MEAELTSVRLLSVVDDDDSFREATGRFMRSLDFTVELFRSAEEFLKCNRLQEVSCLVLDVRLPGMSGLQLQRHLAERGYRIPIISITASPNEGTRARWSRGLSAQAIH